MKRFFFKTKRHHFKKSIIVFFLFFFIEKSAACENKELKKGEENGKNIVEKLPNFNRKARNSKILWYQLKNQQKEKYN